MKYEEEEKQLGCIRMKRKLKIANDNQTRNKIILTPTPKTTKNVRINTNRIKKITLMAVTS